MRHTASFPSRGRVSGFRVALFGGLLLALGACTEDPFERPGTWRATGANDANLQAHVVDQGHLRRGIGASTDRGQAGSVPITVLEAGKRPPAPTTALSAIGQSASSSGGGGAPAGAR